MFEDFFKSPSENELRRQLSSLAASNEEVLRRVKKSEQTIFNLQKVQQSLPAAPAANQLFNGELGHSVNSWFDSSYVPTDESKECAPYFTHGAPFSPKTFTTIGTADTVTITGHGLTLGHEVRFSTTGTLPTGLVAATTYFVIPVDANNFKVASTHANAYSSTALPITAATGSGTHTVYAYVDLTDARASSTNNTLRRSNHSAYDARVSDWDGAKGQGRFTGTRTIDTPLPSNSIEPGNPVYISFIAALRNRYISFADSARILVGLWDDTLGRNDFLTGSVALEGETIGSPATTVERRYRIFVETDRGYSILSNEVTVTDAPGDPDFSTSNYVALNWRPLSGVLRVQIWRYTPLTGVYHLLEEDSAGRTNYIDLNTFLRTDTGYPTATSTERKAVFYSLTGEVAGLNTDGVSGAWSTVRAPVSVPDNYDKSGTTGRQWMRAGITEAANLVIDGVTSDGSTTVTAPTAGTGIPTAFESAYAAQFVGLAVKVYDSTGALTQTTTVSSRTNDTQIVLAASVAAASGQTIEIVGGGFHAVLFDKVHLCFQSNASFAPNPLDARALQPVAAPSSSSQGTVGGGGPGGVDNCLRAGTPVECLGGPVLAENLHRGAYLLGENIRPNLVTDIRVALERTRRVVIEAPDGTWELECTEGERFRTGVFDERGTELRHLRTGDEVFISHDGRDFAARILDIGVLQAADWVYHPSLAGGHYFRAGKFKPSFWRRLKEALGLEKPASGGAYLHNNKSPDIPI
jgi:hypothetical protein